MGHKPDVKARTAHANKPSCYLCQVTFKNIMAADDAFCHGCKQHICESCSVNLNLPMGGHDPYEHRDEAEEIEDDDE